MNKVKNKIVIVTTEGCEACSIAEDNITSAVAQSSVDVDIEVKDFHEFSRQEQKNYKLKDYPTTLYFIEDNLVYKAVGTYPIPVYIRWIDIYFKN